MATKRFLDQNKSIYFFSDYQMVVCPQCAQCADIVTIARETKPQRAKLTCLHCGYNAQKQWTKLKKKPSVPTDFYFHLPLWLQYPCEGHRLWAYNVEHLQYLRDFIAADLRVQRKYGGYSWDCYSVVGRLPRCAQLATNRDKVLAIMDKMLKKTAK